MRLLAFDSTDGCSWNCVTMNGMTAGALAIYDEDTTGTAKKMLSLSIPSALNGCAMAISSDGTWCADRSRSV